MIIPQLDCKDPIMRTFNRRKFLALGTLGAVGLALAPAWSFTATAQGIAIAAYHDATGAAHQNEFDANDGLFKKGYTNSAIFAGVFEKDATPFVAKHDVNRA